MRGRHPEDGLGLVELIVSAALGAIILVIVSAVFISGTIANETTSGRNQSTLHALWVSDSLADGIRNASDVRVSLGGDRVDARVAVAGGWACRAWMLKDGNLIHTTSPSDDPDDWAILGSGVAPVGAFAFELVPAVGRPDRLRVRLTITVESVSTPVALDITAEAEGEGTPASC